MSTKTTFKRIALVAVAALGLGLLSTGPSQAAITGETLTATASATSITTGDSVTITVTNEWTSSSTADTRSIGVDSSTTGSTSGAIQKIYARTSNDTVNALVGSGAAVGVAYRLDDTVPRLTETATPAAGPARYNKVVTTLMLQNFSKSGTYYVTVYSASSGAGPTTATAVKTVSFTITVTDAAPVGANVYVSSDTNTGSVARGNFGATTADTAIAASAGAANAPKFVGYMFPVVLTGSPADSNTAGGTNFCSTQSANATLGTSAGYCGVSVSVSGPGLIRAGALGSNPSKSAILSLSNNGTDAMSSTDTLVVYSDGTSGTGTITFTMGSVTIATKTVTFYGAAATITPYFVDTVVSVSTSAQTAVKALVKDSGSNTLAGTTKVYAFSSDTKVISDSGTACSYDTTYAMHSCALTFVDTGTATITLRDASGVAASTIASTALSFTVRGTKVASVTASFDKATYAPGEKAILTVVTKDLAGSFMDNTTVSNAYTISTNRDSGSSSNVSTSSTPLLATDGVETRVVYMPVTGGVFEYKFTAGTGSVAAANGGWTSVTASANVADPTKDAADAATDAALEATDAAYAAQDAAQLAAEAADAATAAAEAATAAVEDLATQVASLFADLQKQITTLANVVAKIAKKVKA